MQVRKRMNNFWQTLFPFGFFTLSSSLSLVLLLSVWLLPAILETERLLLLDYTAVSENEERKKRCCLVSSVLKTLFYGPRGTLTFICRTTRPTAYQCLIKLLKFTTYTQITIAFKLNNATPAKVGMLRSGGGTRRVSSNEKKHQASNCHWCYHCCRYYISTVNFTRKLL